MSLNSFYRALGISKQGVHDLIKRQNKKREIGLQTLFLVQKIRMDHPTMGVREMYHKLNPGGMGRDIFESLCMNGGFRVQKKKNYRKTTDSQGVTRFKNLIKGIKIERVNQIWQSDITYYELKGKFYYITLIQDAFTKVIVGHQCSTRLTTVQTTLPALEMATKKYREQDLTGLIFHSDGGGQYYAKEFRSLTKYYKIENSMAKDCYENAMAESLNGVIKNKYLDHMSIDSFEQLCKQLDRVVSLYNYDKPHSGLNRLTPKEFEKKYLPLIGQPHAANRSQSLQSALDPES